MPVTPKQSPHGNIGNVVEEGSSGAKITGRTLHLLSSVTYSYICAGMLCFVHCVWCRITNNWVTFGD